MNSSSNNENSSYTEMAEGDVLEEEETTEDLMINVNTGERVSRREEVEGEEDTGTIEAGEVMVEVNQDDDDDDDASGLTTNQILLGILGALNTRNDLARETNKRLRSQNKILRRIAGFELPTDKTLQGTPPKYDDGGEAHEAYS